MNAFLSGLISIILLFSFCFTISACFYKILLFKRQKPKPQPQRKRRRRQSEVIYYIESEQPQPKPKKQTIAIKGTLLNKTEINKIMKKGDD